ncbi:MAG: hypothetical protein PHY87_00730 [Sphaerochaeta sp.]|nr:hypothetical protein [Sphaerochaeta sp.]MDD3928304.1 hypothetical protein [Sphaerochaeta sp.]
MTTCPYFDTVHSIESWRNILTPNAFPFIFAGESTFLAKLFRLPVGLFTTFYTSRFLNPIGALHQSSVEYLFLLFSLLSLLMAWSAHRSCTKRYHAEHTILVEDILSHDEFLKLKTFRHHTNHIYDHAQRVSYLSYRISKALGLNFRAAARGGLLHDFFLYDWRERKATDEKRSSHGKEHPYIALRNAQTYFEVDAREEDIITKHMFPKTLQLPRYPESVVVSLSDKISAIYEYLARP